MPQPQRIDRDQVRELWSRGLLDAQIAARLGCSPAGVKSARRALGIRGHGASAVSCRERQRQRLAEQLAAAGARSLRQLTPGDRNRQAAYAALARRYGLPGDLHPCQVLVCLALATGPKTIAELVSAAGRNPRPTGDGDAYHAFNAPKWSNRNYLKDLRARELVAYVQKRRVGRRGYAPGHYLLTAMAMEMLSNGGADAASA